MCWCLKSILALHSGKTLICRQRSYTVPYFPMNNNNNTVLCFPLLKLATLLLLLWYNNGYFSQRCRLYFAFVRRDSAEWEVCDDGCRRKWGFQKVRGRLRREVGTRLVGCYSVYIIQTLTVISLIEHALYTHRIKTLNIIIVWTESVALLSKAELELQKHSSASSPDSQSVSQSVSRLRCRCSWLREPCPAAHTRSSLTADGICKHCRQVSREEACVCACVMHPVNVFSFPVAVDSFFFVIPSLNHPCQ